MNTAQNDPSALSIVSLSRTATRLGFLIGLLAAGGTATANPTVADLLSVCDRASAQGNTGKNAAACEWYAAPCACKFRGPETPRWCIPESEPIDATVRKVVAGLRRYSDKQASTDRVVPEVLGKLYPCE